MFACSTTLVLERPRFGSCLDCACLQYNFSTGHAWFRLLAWVYAGICASICAGIREYGWECESMRQYARVYARGPFFHMSPEVCTCRRLQIPTAARGLSACISGTVLHLSPEVCTCRRLQKRTAARRYKCMHLGVRSSPVPGGVLAEGCKNESQQAAISLLYVHAFRGPFLTCPRRCALAEGCKNETQHAGISACISGSVLHLSPEVCTCGKLQKRTAARRHKCMHLGVRSSPVPGGLHLQKAAKTNCSTQA